MNRSSAWDGIANDEVWISRTLSCSCGTIIPIRPIWPSGSVIQPAMTSERPQRFGPYILLHAAGAGGMGRVHLAVSGRAGMAKLCVLKRIHDDARSPEQEARFRREATVALRLSHGAIAQTFSVDEIEGDLC